MAADFIKFIEYLLPGFLAAWVFYGFTSFIKPNQFERVVQALIFTVIIETLLKALDLVVDWDVAENRLLLSVPLGAMLGLLFSGCTNNNFPHSAVNFFRVSRETSYPSEWYGEFSKRVTYIVLHLQDGRRLYGWPLEWPSQPNTGHFSISQASWLTVDENNNTREIFLDGVDAILISGSNVSMVEFMKKTW